MTPEQARQQQVQRDYYARTASNYDQQHLRGIDEHQFALAWMGSIIDLFQIKSVLDIGSGTGRALLTLKEAAPHLRVVGIEPSKELREVGHGKGLREDELIDGDVHALDHADGSFDLVSEFATLHHVPDPARAVSEMLRVAREAIFISDTNKLSRGSLPVRLLKRTLNGIGLWGAFDYVRTCGKRYQISEGDGLFYSYSVFDNHRQIEVACQSVHVLNTSGKGEFAKYDGHTIALLGLKGDRLTGS